MQERSIINAKHKIKACLFLYPLSIRFRFYFYFFCAMIKILRIVTENIHGFSFFLTVLRQNFLLHFDVLSSLFSFQLTN